MLSPDTDIASVSEVRRLISRLVALKSKWPSEPSLPALSSRMINGLLHYNRAVERGYPIMRVSFLAMCGLLLWLNATILPMLSGLSFVLLVTLYYVYVTRASQEYRCAAYALTQTNDLRVLPTLIQATHHEWGRHPHIYAAIFHLLDRIQDTHVGLLNAATQQRLWTIGIEWSPLAVRFGDEIALRTLFALAAVGNQTTLWRMRRLVLYYEQFPSEHRVIATARELIPILEARLVRQQIPETLLRAAEAPTNQPDMLLRTSHTTTPEPPRQLLRASMEEEWNK